MTQERDQVRADFDRLAALPASWDHNSHYHRFLLRHVPAGCGDALEVGCGAGAFARLLAQRAGTVYALDLSPAMIALARERSAHCPNIVYQLADITTLSLPDARFGCIASIATLHHLPLAPVLRQLAAALRPGGVLLVLDLDAAEGPGDWLRQIPAVCVSGALRLWKQGRLREPAAVRAAWAEHGQHDTYLPVSEVRRVAAELLPGARVRKHLLWRYSLVWRKPA